MEYGVGEREKNNKSKGEKKGVGVGWGGAGTEMARHEQQLEQFHKRGKPWWSAYWLEGLDFSGDEGNRVLYVRVLYLARIKDT